MEMITPKPTSRLTGFGLLIILLLMCGDQVTVMLPDQEPDVSGSWLSNSTRTIVPHIPIYFEMNMGQTHESVKYLSRGKSHTLFLTPTKAVLSLTGTREQADVLDPVANRQPPALEYTKLSLQLAGSNPESKIEGINKLDGRSNYLIGNDPARWQKNVPHYEMVKYSNVYEGIDLVYHTRKGNLEYDFVVAPGADPGKIRLNITGAEEMMEDASGNLVLKTGLGDVMIKAPETYQEIDGEKEYIASDFEIDEGGQVTFRLDPYDESKPLVIDPELLYSTYLGGGDSDSGLGIDVDNEGNVYVTGFTKSADFPAGNGSPSLAGESDVFVTKLNTLTSEVIFTTFIGGSYREMGLHIGLDNNKDITVTGWTCSHDFPVKNAIQSNLGDGFGGDWENGDVFALKLDAEGSSLIYSTYLGGKKEDDVYDAVFDPGGDIYLSGFTESYYYEPEGICTNHFPSHPKNYEEYPDHCSSKHFVAKINAKGELQYSTLFESTISRANCLAVNKTGNAYLLQWSYHWHVDYEIPWNLFTIIILNGSGTDLVDSLSILFSSDDLFSWTHDFQLDDQENLYIAGVAEGGMVPVTSNAYQPSYKDDRDGFIVKLNKDASKFLYATYLGGSGYDNVDRIYIDNKGCILLYGQTESADFPVLNAYQSNFAGISDAFLSRIDPLKNGAASLLFSTYLGGENYDGSTAFAVDVNEKIYLTGRTYSDSFPVKDALISALPGTNSAFVTVFGTAVDTIDLIYDKVVILGPPIFTPLLPPNTQQVLPQFLLKKKYDTLIFRFEGRRTDSRVGLRVTNTFVDLEPPLVLEMEVWDPDNVEIPTWTIHNIGEGNRGVQFDVTKNGYYIVKVWAEPLSGPFPAPFQIHLAGNVGWPQPLLFPIPNTPPGGIPDTIRATRQDILINAPAPRPQLVRGRLGQVLYDSTVEVSQTSLFKFVNIFQVSEHAVAVLTPFYSMGFRQGRAPVRMLDPNPMVDITTPTAPFNDAVYFPGGGYVVDFTQVPIPAAINVPVQLRHAAVLGKADGNAASLPVQIRYKDGWISTPTFILDMGSGQEIVNGGGNDFRVISPQGNYRVAVSNTVFENTFIPIGGTFSGDQEFDLQGTFLRSARYVRIIADPAVSIDAVQAFNFFCDEIRTNIGPISKVSHITLTARRTKAPETRIDPLIELIGPDGALNATNESGFGDDLSINYSDAALINMELNQEGFYRYLGRGHDKVPNEESFGFFYTRYESAGSYDQTEITVSESVETDLTAQRKVNITKSRQRDSYLFQAAPNQIINIAVSSSEIDVMLELYDPEEFLIAACDNHPGRGTNALISVEIPDSSFVGQAPLPALNTYRIVVSAIDFLGSKKSQQAPGAYVRKAAVGEYAMKVFTSDELVGITDLEQGSFALHDNYPNPFSQQTAIGYELPVSAHVVMEIYDLSGRMIIPLVNEMQPAGKYNVHWHGNDGSGHRIPDGVYICRMKAGEFTGSKTLMLYR